MQAFSLVGLSCIFCSVFLKHQLHSCNFRNLRQLEPAAGLFLTGALLGRAVQRLPGQRGRKVPEAKPRLQPGTLSAGEDFKLA